MHPILRYRVRQQRNRLPNCNFYSSYPPLASEGKVFSRLTKSVYLIQKRYCPVFWSLPAYEPQFLDGRPGRKSRCVAGLCLGSTREGFEITPCSGAPECE